MSINDTLRKIQQGLHVPKSRPNRFGGFNYRNAEDIYSAVKPLLEENEVTLTLSDDVVMMDGWGCYVKSTARLANDDGEIIETSAIAREDLERKKYDSPQLTGSATSYARKYALGGLFLISDEVDPDEELDEQEEEEKPYNEKDEIPDDEMPFNADEDETPKRRRRKRR